MRTDHLFVITGGPGSLPLASVAGRARFVMDRIAGSEGCGSFRA
ncbi:hypothetical protein OK349_15535 [Sphingomonas sp. BT-65]|nr:hypothetical protein [Sphingomonas sp. BT-65]MCW4463126.1 hypothetical protein [Sphingomonas sp. BT-65]